MKNMTVAAMAAACNGQLIGEITAPAACAQGVVIDSRQVQPGFVFVAIRGNRVDGHQYVNQAYADGALVVISEQELDTAHPYIRVASTRQALQDLAAFYRNQLDIRVVGISGSVGKTSTREFIAAVLGQKYRVHQTAGNFNNELGLPLTICQIRDEHQVAVLEMGISDFWEMDHLAAMARPDVAVLTNIGPAHLENLGSRAGVLQAKTEMFNHLADEARVILNGDDDMLATVAQVQGQAPLFYGVGVDKPVTAAYDQKQIYADDIQNRGLDGMDMTLHTVDTAMPVYLSTPGGHRIYNALAAAAVGHQMGLSADEIRRGLESIQGIEGRTHLIKTKGITVIDDCYNANPLSMRAAIDLLATAPGRTVAVLGDMGELGVDAPRMHYDVGAYLAARGIDVLFCAGALSHEMARGMRENNSKCVVRAFDGKDDMRNALLPFLQRGDAILVKASHFMAFSDIVQEIIRYTFD